MARVFGTAGVRGVFNESQTPSQVYAFAQSIPFVFGRGSYGVAWDGRKTSALLARTVASAVNSVGSDVQSFGMAPTPVLAFGTRNRHCEAGFSVTASHNPPEFSGVKLFNRNGMEIPKSDEARVERALSVSVMRSGGKFGSVVPDFDVVEEYIDSIVSRYDHSSAPLRIAIDCANGPGGFVTPRILKGLGHDVIPVNSQISWRFTARRPEPTSETLEDFSRVVANLGVDFGFAHDGDADRLVMLDREGRVLPDSVVACLALHGLVAASGTVVISENTSMMVAEEAQRMGFTVLRSRVGKTFALLQEKGGVFATEPSKIIDPTWGLWEDGINAAAMISCLLARDPGLLDKVLQTGWNYRQTNIAVPVDMRELQERARDFFRKFGIAEERTLDGYKIVFEDGSWIMFRASGTEPKTRIYCESKKIETLDTLIQEGVRCVELSRRLG